MRLIDLTGRRFGRLLVIERSGSVRRKDGHGTFPTWRCRCDCGKEAVVRGVNLKSAESCGCFRRSVHAPGVAGLLRVFRAYEAGASKRGYAFTLTFEQFTRLTALPCHYCGAEPETKAGWSKYTTVLYSGLDRVDNGVGYLLENCVPCCVFCNKAKGTKSYVEFQAWIARLIAFRRSR